MPETSRRLRWVRETDRYPDATETDSFIALDGEAEVGVVKLIPAPAGSEWMLSWIMLLTHPGPAFRLPKNGRCKKRGEAVGELLECWRAFRDWWFEID